MTMSSTLPSPSLAAVAGLWKRQSEEDPIGDTVNADRDTLVLWTQAKESGIYVDIRLSKDSPGLSLEAAKDISKRPSALDGTISHSLVSHLEVLTRQKSFAGVLDVKAGDTTGGQAIPKDPTLRKLVNDPHAILPLCTCFWRRDIDYQPPTGDLDIGVCASAATVVDGHLWLRETGADASYAEDWSRPADTTTGPFMALTLVDETDRTGFWVRAGNRFAYAVGRPTGAGPSAKVHTSVGKTLAEATQDLASTNTECLDILGSYIGVAGRINDQNEWVIHHSINPELVGCLLVCSNSDVSCCSQLHQNEDDIVVQIIPSSNGKQVRRTWKVVELSSGCKLPL